MWYRENSRNIIRLLIEEFSYILGEIGVSQQTKISKNRMFSHVVSCLKVSDPFS